MIKNAIPTKNNIGKRIGVSVFTTLDSIGTQVVPLDLNSSGHKTEVLEGRFPFSSKVGGSGIIVGAASTIDENKLKQNIIDKSKYFKL